MIVVAEGHNSPLHLVRKAIVIQRAFMAHGTRVKPHHKTVLQALRVAKALIQAGFDLEMVIAALQAVGGGDCNLPVPATEQSHDVNHVSHAPDRRPEGSHEDANPLHHRTNSLRGREDNA